MSTPRRTAEALAADRIAISEHITRGGTLKAFASDRGFTERWAQWLARSLGYLPMLLSADERAFINEARKPFVAAHA